MKTSLLRIHYFYRKNVVAEDNYSLFSYVIRGGESEAVGPTEFDTFFQLCFALSTSRDMEFT